MKRNRLLYIYTSNHFCCTLETQNCQSTMSSVQSLSLVRLFASPWISARQASLSITNSQSLLKLMPIESVMPSSHLILCHPLLLLPSILPSIRVFSNESVLHIRSINYTPIENRKFFKVGSDFKSQK